ncbi:MAG: phosphoenolpyruvate synthase [Candidatus Doudnabacteria bacterium]|nr:phosphoenolpyruvate synthase [Candidatus Doudnabacteria bacterium]
MNRNQKHILKFGEITIKDVPLVGGKNASLGEMYQKLQSQGVPVPNGFAVTATAYRDFLKFNKLDQTIRGVLKGLNTRNVRSLASKGAKIRSSILEGKMPEALEREILESYGQLSRTEGAAELDVAVRSSATAEDLPGASFAGQQETYLNIRGRTALLDAVKKCFASLFTDRAISYRVDQGFDQTRIYLSVTVQRMVRSDFGASGVMFTLDTDSGFRDVVLINAAYGLGENVVKGVVNPDEFLVFKPTLAKAKSPVISKNLGSKHLKMIYSSSPGRSTKNVEVAEADRNRFAITDGQAATLARWGVIIEQHYGKPMDMEWAYDGRIKKLFIVQARPETIHALVNPWSYEEYLIERPKISRIRSGLAGKVLAEGVAVGSKIGVGKARVILDASKIAEFKPGEVLVTEITDPDWEPIMKIASAIVTNSGGRTSHAAIVSREIGIPAVVGTGAATKQIRTGQLVTVSCAEGETGRVYEGKIKYRLRQVNLKSFRKPKTKIMMNVGDPVAAFDFSFVPNSGVGLAREEFIINDYIKVHPLALMNFSRLKDKKAKSQIQALTAGYPDKQKFFVDKLAYGIARIAAAFYPNDVILRFSDFKTNEYATLLGGEQFEPKEANPMIGWRGASRYYDPKFKPAFGLECRAVKKVREEMGLVNLKVMVPFCRTPEEGKKVLETMRQFGLSRGQKGLEVYVMAEIPSNVVDAANFCKLFDGFSIGSNDLTQLALGVDRDSDLVAHIYDERNVTVTRLIAELIKVAHKYKRKVGICGQGPSDHPDFAQFLVRAGIDSISLNPDSVLKTTLKILEMEKRMRR